MTPTASYIKRLSAFAAALSVCAAVVVSCSDGVEIQQPEPTAYEAAFYITVGDEAPSVSRATPTNGEYDPGEGFENYIDLTGGNLRIAVLDPYNNLMGEMTDFFITPLESWDSSKRYLLNASTTANLSGGNFKIMVLANWGKDNYPQDLTLENVWAAKFDYKPGVLGYDNLIPLFGIKEFKVGTVEPDVAVELGTIHLLRALAKVEVIYDDPSGFCDIETPEITLHHTSGFCAPAADSESDYVKNDWNADYVGDARTPADAEVAGSIAMTPEGRNRWVIYLPEFDHNVNTHANAQIAVEFKEDIYDRQLIDFRDGARIIDIMRNYWYRVTVKKGISHPIVTVDVMPYAIVDLEPDFGIIPDKKPETKQ